MLMQHVIQYTPSLEMLSMILVFEHNYLKNSQSAFVLIITLTFDLLTLKCNLFVCLQLHYTPCPEKRCHFIFFCNSAKC